MIENIIMWHCLFYIYYNFFQLLIYRTSTEKDSNVFFSLLEGNVQIKSGDYININGLYAEKLFIKDKQEVISIKSLSICNVLNMYCVIDVC